MSANPCCWSLTATPSGDTTMGIAEDCEAGLSFALAAAHSAIDHARLTGGPATRYELRVNTDLAAIIQTGTTSDGAPDHAETGALLARIEGHRWLSGAPY